MASSPSRNKILALILLLVAAGGAGYWYLEMREAPKSAVNDLAPKPRPSLAAKTPAIRYPVPAETTLPMEANEPPPPPKIPDLDESDPTLESDLTRLIGKTAFANLVMAKNLVRRLVVSIDTITGKNFPTGEVLPWRPIQPGFKTQGMEPDEVISEKNFDRYNAYVAALGSLNVQKAFRIYSRYYKLFQAAYADLGTPGYFNDRLVAVIDHILETPPVSGPLKVSRISVHHPFKYADEKLEALSPAQKLLLRMGPIHTQTIKNKLTALRALLIKAPPQR